MSKHFLGGFLKIHLLEVMRTQTMKKGRERGSKDKSRDRTKTTLAEFRLRDGNRDKDLYTSSRQKSCSIQPKCECALGRLVRQR